MGQQSWEPILNDRQSGMSCYGWTEVLKDGGARERGENNIQIDVFVAQQSYDFKMLFLGTLIIFEMRILSSL